MTVARIVIGTIVGIPEALRLAEAGLDDLYEVAKALQDAQNAVLSNALDVVALEEGRRIAADWRRQHGPAPRPDPGPSAA